jgi:predicted transglutaminase-like cysteine proteinase
MWNKIRQVNQYVNTTIRPTTDQELYGQPEFWTYPTAAAGDCEDYALLKQRYLIGLDIPVQDLLLTVLKDEKGDGHALLTVVTDQGEFALDMRRSEILLATNAETGYTFLKRQSQTNQHQWVTLVAPHGVDTTVSTK